MFAQKELSVDEFRKITNKSINQICQLTGADRDTVYRHKNNATSDRPQYVQFRYHLGLLAQVITK
jgi:hypothetical protein